MNAKVSRRDFSAPSGAVPFTVKRTAVPHVAREFSGTIYVTPPSRRQS